MALAAHKRILFGLLPLSPRIQYVRLEYKGCIIRQIFLRKNIECLRRVLPQRYNIWLRELGFIGRKLKLIFQVDKVWKMFWKVFGLWVGNLKTIEEIRYWLGFPDWLRFPDWLGSQNWLAFPNRIGFLNWLIFLNFQVNSSCSNVPYVFLDMTLC